MSDAAPDRPASPEGPPLAAPRPVSEGAPAADNSFSSSDPGATGIGAPSRRRRRGSRGGRNRTRPSVDSGALDGGDGPEAAVEAADKPLAGPAKPKIGDSRPAPSAASSAAGASARAAPRRGAQGGRRRSPPGRGWFQPVFRFRVGRRPDCGGRWREPTAERQWRWRGSLRSPRCGWCRDCGSFGAISAVEVAGVVGRR